MNRTVEKRLLHQQVYDILKNDILTGKLKSGEKVNENVVAQEFGVSRSPVREAIRMLEQDELVIMGSAGTIVNPLESDVLRDLYECRIVMESYAVRIATPYYTEEELQELEHLLEKSEQYFQEKNLEDLIYCNTKFHDCLINVCKNERLKKTIRKYQELSLLARREEVYANHKRETFISEHREIVKAIRRRDQDAVESNMRIHIQNDLNSYRQNHISKE